MKLKKICFSKRSLNKKERLNEKGCVKKTIEGGSDLKKIRLDLKDYKDGG